MAKEIKKESLLKSRLFLEVFAIPYAVWFILSLSTLIPDETDLNPVTWNDFLISNIVILLVWFVISVVIVFLVHKFKGNNSKINITNKEENIIKMENRDIVIAEELKEEQKRKIIKKKDEKCLYICENVVGASEYKKMVNYFPSIYWAYVIYGSILNIVFSFLVSLLTRDIVTTLIFFVIVQIFLMILYSVKLEQFAETTYNKKNKENKGVTNTRIEFYENYLIQIGESATYKFIYSDMSKCIETDTNFYLYNGKKNFIIIIKKEQCALELINFIKGTFENLETYHGNKRPSKIKINYHSPEFIKTFMLILFIITIASLWGAQFSLILIEQGTPKNGWAIARSSWVLWCWLPIPILSIILGFKYKKLGYKCTKNIVSGFIVGFILLIYGSFWMLPTFLSDYKEIDVYRNIVDANLPNSGELEILNVDLSDVEDKTEYTIINAYYNKENVSDLEKSIENNSNWILSKKIKSQLKIFIPLQFSPDYDAYYSIYNKTTNQYNTLPEKSGSYEIYAMKYDKSEKCLEIHKFKYFYR